MATTTNAPLSNKDQLLAAWKAAASASAAAVAEERALRSQVIEAFSQETDPMKSGVENVAIGWDWKLKITHKLNYKLDNANDCEALHKVLEKIAKSMEGGNIIAERIVKWKPELSLSEYKLLGAPQKALIDSVLTVEPASKAIELVPPAGAK